MLGKAIRFASNNPLVSGLVLLIVGSSSLWAWVDPAGKWLSADAHVMRGVIVLLVLLLLMAATVIYKLATALRREPAHKEIAAQPALHQSAAQAAARKFDPDAFELTPLRCRALLALLGRVEALTTLFQVNEAVQTYGVRYIDTSPTTGRLQHDMEEAERVGIVHINSTGGVANYYGLTARGRDWVLRNEAGLKAMAPKGMSERDRGRL